MTNQPWRSGLTATEGWSPEIGLLIRLAPPGGSGSAFLRSRPFA